LGNYNGEPKAKQELFIAPCSVDLGDEVHQWDQEAKLKQFADIFFTDFDYKNDQKLKISHSFYQSVSRWVKRHFRGPGSAAWGSHWKQEEQYQCTEQRTA